VDSSFKPRDHDELSLHTIGHVFPNAACAIAIIDRLTHHAEIISIDGESYRRREAELRSALLRVPGSLCRSC
jgi:hypothetical protein